MNNIQEENIKFVNLQGKSIKVLKKTKEKCTFDYNKGTKELIENASVHWKITNGHIINLLVRCTIGSNRELRHVLSSCIRNYLEKKDKKELSEKELNDLETMIQILE